jgi:hypothetical protein
MTGGAVDLPTAAEMPAELERLEEPDDPGKLGGLEKLSGFGVLGGLGTRCSQCA